MDADIEAYATKYVTSRPQVYDVRIKHAWLDDPRVQMELDGEECRAFINLLRWTESQHSDGHFDRKHVPMVRHLTDERLARMITVGVVEGHGDALRIADPYRSWQSTLEEKKANAAKQYKTNQRVRKHREQEAADPPKLAAVPSAAEELVAQVNRPTAVKKKLADQVDQLLQDRIAAADISAALTEWEAAPDSQPGLLPYLVKPSPLAAALKEARSTGKVSALSEFGFHWEAPNPPSGAKTVGEVRQYMKERKLEWLDEVERKLETA